MGLLQIPQKQVQSSRLGVDWEYFQPLSLDWNLTGPTLYVLMQQTVQKQPLVRQQNLRQNQRNRQ